MIDIQLNPPAAYFVSLGTEQNSTYKKEYELTGWCYFGRRDMGVIQIHTNWSKVRINRSWL